MIVHSKNHVTNVDEKCIQPNAIDIRCSELMEIRAADMKICLGDSSVKKEFFPQRALSAESVLGGSGEAIKAWRLDPLTSYQFETDHVVTVPEGMAGWLIIRSTLSRNGLIMSGGLYDAGYCGGIGGTIHNLSNGTVFLEENSRVGQFIMSDSETAHLYDGHYNQNNGRSIA